MKVRVLFFMLLALPLAAFAQIGEPVKEENPAYSSPLLLGDRFVDSDLINHEERIEKRPKASSLTSLILGKIAIARGDWQNASDYFDDLLATNRESALLEQRIGIEAAQNQLEKALPYVKMLVEISPENIMAWNTLGNIYLEKGQYRNAAHSFLNSLNLITVHEEDGYPIILQAMQFHPPEKKAKLFVALSRLQPKDINPLLYASLLFLETEEYSKVEALLNEAKKIEATNPRIFIVEARRYWLEGELTQGVNILQSAYEEKGGEELALEYLRILIDDFDYRGALELGSTLLESKSISPEIYSLMTYLYVAFDKPEEATAMLQYLEKDHYLFFQTFYEIFNLSLMTENYASLLDILPFHDDFPQEYIINYETLRASLFLQRDDYLRFYETFEQLRMRYPQETGRLYLTMLERLEAFGKVDKLMALLTLLEGAEIVSEDYETYLTISALYKEKEFSPLIELLETTLKKKPNDPMTLNMTGYVMLEIGEEINDSSHYGEALDYILQANELLPRRDFIEDSVGWAYYLLHNYEKAEKFLTQAFRKSNRPEIIGHYILVLDKIGDKKRAKRLWRTFKEVYRNTEAYQQLAPLLEPSYSP